MYHLLAVVLLLAADGLADQPLKLTNIGFISNGYDIIIGNPHEDQLDPGFTQEIFQLSYNLGTLSGDGKWLLPDHIEADQATSCSFAAESQEVTGTTSYRDALSVDASVKAAVKGGTYGVEFSASAGYSKIQQNTQSSNKLYTTSTARCTRYVARVTQHTAINFTESFVSSVMDLPLQPDNESYLEFISTFGTHYLSQMTMGAKFVLTTEFEETAWMSLEQESISVSAAATVDVLAFSGSVSVMSDSEQETAKKFSDKKSSRKESYLGSKPPKDGRWETWAEDAGSSPYPISYVLRPLTELFKHRYFRDMNSTELTMKRNILDAMYTAYCGSLANCGNASADRVPLKMDAVSDLLDGPGTIFVKCRPGFWPLSCGLKGYHNKDSTEPVVDGHPQFQNFDTSMGIRYAFPNSQTRTCDCKTTAEQKIYCYAWCVNRDTQFYSPIGVTYMDGSNLDYSVTSFCGSPEMQAIGCSGYFDQEIFGRFESQSLPLDISTSFPTVNGDGCDCLGISVSSNKLICYANCMPYVKNYEVRKTTGNGWITATCSDSNVVLGCAAKLSQVTSFSDADIFLASYYVAEGSFNACTCYSGHPKYPKYITCYAMCGQFV